MGICVSILVCLIFVNLTLPSSDSESWAGIEPCSAGYWALTISFFCVCFILSFIAIRINQGEQRLKIKYGINHQEGDLIYTGKNLYVLMGIGFAGGLIAGALGLGGGSIYNPAFLYLGIHPKVSGATGMFLVMISTVNSVLLDTLNGYELWGFALFTAVFALVGSFGGMLGTDALVRATGRPSVFVWMLVAIFGITTIGMPISGGIQAADMIENGESIWEFASFC